MVRDAHTQGPSNRHEKKLPTGRKPGPGGLSGTSVFLSVKQAAVEVWNDFSLMHTFKNGEKDLTQKRALWA